MKARLALIVAILLGAGAAFGVRRYLQRKETEINKLVKPVKILVAKKRIPKGVTIMGDMIKEETVGASGLTRLHLLERDKNLVVNQRSNRDIERNTPLTRDYFEEVKLNLDRNEQVLRKGQRAVTISVDAVSGVAGNIRPGSHVDVFGTFEVAAQAGSSRGRGTASATRTVLMLSDITVLAVDNRTTATQYSLAARRQGAIYSSVTVAVTPEESMLLVYGQHKGKLTLVLRNAMDVLPGPSLKDVDSTNLFRRVDNAKNDRRKRAEEKAISSD